MILEVARAIEGKATCDWDDKFVLQVTRRELPDVLAVVLGWIETCEFKYHGPARNKRYQLRDDGLRLMLEVLSKTASMRPVALARRARARRPQSAPDPEQRHDGSDVRACPSVS